MFASELMEVCLGQSERLVLCFDQALARGRERDALDEKLAYFRAHGVGGLAYVSHASFLALSSSEAVLETARDRLTAWAARARA